MGSEILTQSTGTGTSAGQVSQSPITESQPKSSSSATDQSSSGSGTEGTVVTKSVEPTKVTLDINSSQGTNQFDYTKSDKINTFRVKDGHVFSKVTKGTTDIWDSKGGECGTKVIFIDENKKYVSILLTNNMFLLFHLESGQWKDITSTKHDITRLKFFGDNDATLCQNDYDVTIADYSYRFTLKAGVNCKKIKYADDDLWKDTDDSEFAEITAFDLGLISNSFFVKNKTKFKKLDFNPTQAKGGPVTPEGEAITATSAQQTGSVILAELPPEKASVTVLSPTGRPRPSKTPEVSTGSRTAITLNIGERESNSAIEFKEDYLKNVTVFSAKEKYVFNKIIKTGGSNCCGSRCCDSETVIWQAKDQTEHFHTVYVDGLGTFSSTSNLSLHLCNGTFKHFNKPSCGNWTPSPGVVDLDLKISNSNIQVDFFQKDNFRIYVAKPGYTIRKVVKKDTNIWAAKPDDHALKVVLMGSKKEPKHLAVLKKSGGLTLLSKIGKGEPWEDITSSKNKITDLKMYAMADDKETVELHRGHYSITLFNGFYGYVFYDGVGCVKVTHKGKNIWDLREEGDFGCLKGVFLDLKSNKFNVMNDDDRCWVCEQVRKVNPVTLDVSSKASTDDFDFTIDHNRNIMVYTSKGNAMFYQVIKKSSTNCCGSTCCDSETVIWETNDPKGYASKVFADGVGACSSTKNVSIYLLNGDILHFGKGGRNKPWKPSVHKIILDVDKTSSTIGYDFVHHGETRTFTVKPGYQFKTVKLGSSWKWLVCGSSCCNSGCLGDHIFWEAERDEEWSNMVTVYGVETNVKNVNIFLNNNQVKHFHKADKKWVSKTTIVLNIEKNTDNDLFEYRSTRNFGHFNPKPNLTITMIVKSTLKIWTAEPDDHGLKAVLMGSGKDEKFLSILLQSGNFVLLRKCGKGECWEDITKEKSDFSGIKMYSLEEGTSNYHLLTENDYDAIIFESRYGYEFKDGVKCVKITYNDKLLWSHTDDPEFGYLKGLYLDLPKDQFSVTNLKDQTKQLTKAKVTKVTLDINKKVSTSDFEHSESHDFHKYTAKFCRVFSKVVQDTTDIWDSGDDVFGTSVGFTSKDGQNYVVVLLDNGNFKLFRLDAGNWTDITSSKFDVKMLEFYDKNDNELTSSNYTVELLGHSSCFTISYVFDRGPKCTTVSYGYDIVYFKNMFSCYKTINRFDFNPVSNTFYAVKNCCDWRTIDYKPPHSRTKVTLDIDKTETTEHYEYFKDDDCEKYSAKTGCVFSKVSKGTTNIWESIDDVFSTLVRSKTKDDGIYLAVLLTNNMFKLFHLESGKPWADITSERHDVTKLKFIDESDTELKASDFKVTIVDYAYQFTFKSGVSCRKIKLEEYDVWKPGDDPKFSTIRKFQLGLISNSFFVINNNNESKKLEFKPTPETAVVITKVSVTKPAVTHVTLDIDKTESTNEFDYTDQNGVITYAPKDNHVFSKVSQGTTDIWESSDDVFGTLVRTKTTKGVKFLVVLLTNNMFTLFHLDGNEWKNITSDRHDVTMLKFLGENDAEITSSDYSVSIVDLSFTYIFNSGVKCKKIMLADDEVWNHTDDAKFSDIKSFSLGLASNSFFVKNQSDQVKKIEKEAEIPEPEAPEETKPATPPVTTPETKPVTPPKAPEPKAPEAPPVTEPTPVAKPVTKPVISLKAPTPEPESVVTPVARPFALDIEKTESTSQYNYTEHNGVVTYSVKSWHGFNKITQGRTVIWESTDLCGILVRTKLFSNNERFLAMILYNNTFKLFSQSDRDTTWKDITNTRLDVTKLKFLSHNDRGLRNVDFTVSLVDFFYSFNFRNIVKCRKVMYANQDVWIHTGYRDFSEISTFYFGIISNRFFVRNKYGRFMKLEKKLEVSRTAVPTQQPAEPTKQQTAETEQQQPAEPAEPAEPTQQATSTQQSTEAEDSAQAESAETDTSAQPAKPNQPA
ncbi:SfiI-subtelomeric fragment related protein family member, putative [Theileria annulata]|uniref:SfiI-subtelomeric related protein family member, putative n=1 Tax=Theileria annulata TaxID=5874 RepID=Q4UFL3_THEAN|nr:SfiI-subtelomeric fragment related protein family member, putative [Theileria annulata]CAI74103.1 SfiI-subtelomeric fragment related protein family member, putative [Theileria annulata]